MGLSGLGSIIEIIGGILALTWSYYPGITKSSSMTASK